MFDRIIIFVAAIFLYVINKKIIDIIDSKSISTSLKFIIKFLIIFTIFILIILSAKLYNTLVSVSFIPYLNPSI